MYLIFVFVSPNAGSFYLLPINSISNDGYFGSQTDGFFSIAKESLLLHAWVAAENCWCPGQWWIPWSCALSAREVPKCEEHRPSTRSEPSDSQWKQVIWALVVDRNPKFCLLVHIIAWSSTWTKVLPLKFCLLHIRFSHQVTSWNSISHEDAEVTGEMGLSEE